MHADAGIYNFEYQLEPPKSVGDFLIHVNSKFMRKTYFSPYASPFNTPIIRHLGLSWLGVAMAG